MKNEIKPEQAQKKDGLWELVKFAIIALLVVIPIRLFIAQPFVVSGSSMVPTFENGQYLIVDETYRLRNPQRGDVVIFRPPQYQDQPGVFFIKRIIGLPGDTLRLEGTTVTITNSEHPEGFKLDEPYLDENLQWYANTSITLGPDEFFVMGDNRNHSSDSRAWGPLAGDLIVGRAFIRLLPLTNADILPGDYK